MNLTYTAIALIIVLKFVPLPVVAIWIGDGK